MSIPLEHKYTKNILIIQKKNTIFFSITILFIKLYGLLI